MQDATPGRPVFVTDVDGCLIDHHTYSYEPARPALDALAARGVPLVLCSSKTCAELDDLRRRLALRHPFISENGGALHVPAGYFPFQIPGARREGGYDLVPFGAPYAAIVTALQSAAAASGVPVRGFHQMSAEEVAADCGLSVTEAERAKQREHDEPFRVLDPDPAAPARLHAVLRAAGVRVVSGGRYHHASGDIDKGRAAAFLFMLYRRAQGVVRTVAFGDAPNDLTLLRSVDVPVIVRDASGAARQELLEHLPSARVTSAPGPAGWCDAVLALLAEADIPQTPPASDQGPATHG